MLAINGTVDDPLVDEAFVLGAGVDDRLQVVVGLEMLVEVLGPVELIDDEIEVAVLLLGDVLDEKLPADAAALDHRLIHPENVGAPLGLIRQERARRVKDGRRDQPAGAGLEAIRLGMVEDAVVARVPAFEALDDVVSGRAGFKTHEGIGEIVAGGVQLRREVVAFGLPLAADLRGLLGGLMHVVGDGAHVVEKLAVDGPFLVLRPDRLADDLGAVGVDGVLEGEFVPFMDDVAQTFVRRGVLVGRGGRGAEPALVDAASVGAEGVEVLAGELEAGAGHQKGTRDPGGREAEYPFAGFEGRAGPSGGLIGAHPSRSPGKLAGIWPSTGPREPGGLLGSGTPFVRATTCRRKGGPECVSRSRAARIA